MKALPDYFRAPLTGDSLSLEGGSIVSSGGAKFPLFGDTPLLVPDARIVHSELKLRAAELIAHYERTVEALKIELKLPGLSALTTERLKRTREIHLKHLDFLRDIFTPLKLSMKSGAQPTPDFGYKLPSNQALQGYFPNLIRDWSSVHGENEEQFAIVREALAGASLGRLLVCGAGAGRLAYDVHEALLSSETVCCDLNPVLTFAFSRIARGEVLRVAEFPLAPRHSKEASSGAIRELRAPNAARAGLHHVMADTYYLPFADASFDSVMTPWLVDILPHRFEFLLGEINRVLKPGGRWVNTGSFNFRFGSWSESLALNEALEIITQSGFARVSLREDMIPYLRSDLDSHQRNEQITTFVMRKTDETAPRGFAPVMPSWLTDVSSSVPRPPGAQQLFTSLESQAFVLSNIDGKRNIVEIAEIVATRYKLDPTQALAAVSNFILRTEMSARAGVDDPGHG